MITTKIRSNLKSIAHPLKPLMHIGKGGVSESVLNQAREHLYSTELFKIKVLKNCEYTAREITDELAEMLEADVVSCIGGIITLYKLSDKKGIEHVL